MQSSALPLGYGALFNYIFVFYNYAHILKFLSCFNNYDKRRKNMRLLSVGAEDEIRTRDVHLGKVTLYHWATPAKNGASGRNRTTDTGIFSPLLYRLSYRGKNWRPGTGSNRRPLAWQASVLTNWTTGPNVVGTTGLEPVTLCL